MNRWPTIEPDVQQPLLVLSPKQGSVPLGNSDMYYSLKSFSKRGYVRDYIGIILGVIKGDTRSIDFSLRGCWIWLGVFLISLRPDPSGRAEEQEAEI